MDVREQLRLRPPQQVREFRPDVEVDVGLRGDVHGVSMGAHAKSSAFSNRRRRAHGGRGLPRVCRMTLTVDRPTTDDCNPEKGEFPGNRPISDYGRHVGYEIVAEYEIGSDSEADKKAPSFCQAVLPSYDRSPLSNRDGPEPFPLQTPHYG